MAVYCSDLLNNNFILNFIGKFSLFPIIDRRLDEIMKEIKPGKNSNQLSAVANQIRDCYLYLTDYLINKNISQSTDFKQDNFTDNISEFLSLITRCKTPALTEILAQQRLLKCIFQCLIPVLTHLRQTIQNLFPLINSKNLFA